MRASFSTRPRVCFLSAAHAVHGRGSGALPVHDAEATGADYQEALRQRVNELNELTSNN